MTGGKTFDLKSSVNEKGLVDLFPFQNFRISGLQMDLQQAEDLFGSIFHVFRCCFGAHSFLEGDNASKNREERIDSSSIAGRSIAGDAAGETDNRFSELFVSFATPIGAFPMTV